MGNKQILVGKAKGVDLNAAIEDALSAARPPGAGFDFQTLTVQSVSVFRGGFVPEVRTEIKVAIVDGDDPKFSEDLPQPRFESLDDGPVIQGGLSISMIEQLERDGWEKRTLKGDRENIPVSFKSDQTPSGYVVKYGTVPDGTKVMEHEGLKQTIIVRCGNQCPILNKDYVVGH